MVAFANGATANNVQQPRKTLILREKTRLGRPTPSVWIVTVSVDERPSISPAANKAKRKGSANCRYLCLITQFRRTVRHVRENQSRPLDLRAEEDGDLHIALTDASGDKPGIVVAEIPAKPPWCELRKIVFGWTQVQFPFRVRSGAGGNESAYWESEGRGSNPYLRFGRVESAGISQKPRLAASASRASWVIYAKNACDWPMKRPMVLRNRSAAMAAP